MKFMILKGQFMFRLAEWVASVMSRATPADDTGWI